MKLRCHGCGREVEIIEKVGFRQTCEACDTWLHSCVHCRFWSRENCTETSAEKVSDPQAQNYCEWYQVSAEGGVQSAEKGGDRSSAEEMWKKLIKQKEE